MSASMSADAGLTMQDHDLTEAKPADRGAFPATRWSLVSGMNVFAIDPMNPPSTTRKTDLGGLDPAGLLRGALGESSASWPAEGSVTWTPAEDSEVATWFPGYTDVRLIGRGGMGAVYAARQTSLDRQVALKLLPEELSRDAAAAERFRREARALAKLNHPKIVAIHDFGETPGGSFYFVMEQVEGTDLHRLIGDGDLPLAKALDVVRQVCDALEFAHSRGIVHRDIKPANILIDGHGRVKVSDFGLAILLTDPSSESSPTMTNGVVGTPEYIAPEQRRGDGPIDHRADIYSLGVMLYEMLTGTLPCSAFEPPSCRSEVDGKFISNGSWESTEGSWKNPPGMGLQSDTHPVTCVSEVDAAAYCQWLTSRERASGRISGNERYRLPGAAEWHAALGLPADSLIISQLDAVVPINPTATGPSPRDVVPSDLTDLSGSVAEWTSSQGAMPDTRIVCGTSWVEIIPPAGTTTVRAYDQNLRGVGIGFRIVFERKPSKENP